MTFFSALLAVLIVTSLFRDVTPAAVEGKKAKKGLGSRLED